MKLSLLTRWCWRGASVSPSEEVLDDTNGREGNHINHNAEINNLNLTGNYTATNSQWNQWRTILSAVSVVTVIGVVAYFCRDYVSQILIWMAIQDVWVVLLVFLALFTLVSFPFTWGYIIINISAGYMFGTWKGLGVTVCTVTMAVIFVHTLIRGCLREFVHRQVLKSRMVGALLTVLAGTHAFKVIAVTRLTPIPFGLQNAVFAVSGVPTLLYLAATVLGLLPTQILNCYLGTTVRNLQDVVSDSTSATATGWIIFSVQIAISIALTMWVVRRAKAELHKTMAAELTQTSGNSPTRRSPVDTPPNSPFLNSSIPSNGITNLALISTSPPHSPHQSNGNTSTSVNNNQYLNSPTNHHQIYQQQQQQLQQQQQQQFPMDTMISHPHSPLNIHASIDMTQPLQSQAHKNYMSVSPARANPNHNSHLSPSHNLQYNQLEIHRCSLDMNGGTRPTVDDDDSRQRNDVDIAVIEAGGVCLSAAMSSTSCISFGRENSSLAVSSNHSRRESTDDELILLGALDNPA